MEELEQQAQQEIDALYSGTNEWEAEEIETPETETPEAEPEDTKKETRKPMTKAEENFAKILSKKNKAEAEKDSLASRVSELENALKEKDFLSEYPQAKEVLEDIKKEMAEIPWLSYEKAFRIVSQEKWISNRPRGLVWKPAPVEEPKSTDDMSASELQKFAQDSKALEKALRWE